MSAFTIAFQIPNLVRSLFADAALQGAFVPVFTEQLEAGNKREAFRLASTLILLITAVLGVITALFILVAPFLIPMLVPSLDQATQDLTVGLSQLLFPILVMLGVSGVVVGVLNSYNRFAVFAIAPLFWNLAIIARPDRPRADVLEGEERIYAYAIGVLVGTALQLAMVSADLRNTPFRMMRVFDWRSPLVKKVLVLMLPVTISLGLINVNLVINSLVGALVPGTLAGTGEALANYAPASIDKAFRIYMLPQGMFSVAVTTVIFPTLSRYAARRQYDDLRRTMANGMRMILLVLVPAAAAILVLSEPMIRLVYQRGEFSPVRDAARRDGALLVRLLAAVQRALPDPDPDLLQPPAAVDADLDRRREPGDHGRGRLRVLQAVRSRRDRRRNGDRDRGQRRRPGPGPAPAARGDRVPAAARRPRSGSPPPRRRSPGSPGSSGTSSTAPSAAARSPRSSPSAWPWPPAGPSISRRSWRCGCPRRGSCST